MKSLKSRKLKTWNKRIFIQDRELALTKFKPKTKFNAYYIPKLKKIYLISSATGKRTVSKRSYNDNAVIDIKSLNAMSKFQEYDMLKINLFNNQIIIEGINKEDNEFKRYSINKNLLKHKDNNDILKVISLCSGAGLLDLGFKQEGFEIVYAVEKEKDMYTTYKNNIGEHIIHEDLNMIDISKIPDADVLIGGIPCKNYSNANRTTGHIIDSPNNLLIRKYIEVAEAKETLSVFMIENVQQMLTKGKKFIDELKYRLSDYNITIQVIDAKYFGSPQERKRAIILGSKEGAITIENDLSINTFKTVREAFKFLSDDIPNQKDYSNHSNNTLDKIRNILPGQNYNDFIGKDVRHSNYMRRLEYDKYSRTIPNARKSLILHPEFDRVITVREAARLFDLPDNFILHGTLDKKYEMVGNGVPVNVARAVARKIKEHLLVA